MLFQKYPSTMRAACAISEIYSTMRGLCYFRNNHPLWEWLALFQKYPPTMRWAAVRGGIGDSSSCMKIDFFLRKIRFRTHKIIIKDKKHIKKIHKKLTVTGGEHLRSVKYPVFLWLPLVQRIINIFLVKKVNFNQDFRYFFFICLDKYFLSEGSANT